MTGPLPHLDPALAERRCDVRIIVSLPGRYSLANSRNAQGELRRFSCRVVNISPAAAALVAPVRGLVGEWVSAEVEHFGRLEGAITRLLERRGFVMRIAAGHEERSKLTAKIEWFEKYKNLEIADQRTQVRFVPENPFSTLILADGTVMTCFVLDLSASGAAVSADIVPEVGTVLAIGKVIGRVVRHFTEGFAVQFVTRLDRESVAALVLRN